ncbi:MAG TPA: hypothetical protein PLG84_03605 [Anaerolineaceae bacterium]|jgi:hypothetical protein|nr:hypothetical protein [Anaerolineaceae bacterium]HOE34160.1 hypothetical protein [Anaerolineaceae bacterium]HOT25157.1 hypothetical protein [Anaerolineaceae bacterium]HQH57911.1 hypothetical protein [Anaerolineaceae bacterium]HQK02782.1 hypothetical protein [Anaerolineaceae bacterium]
MSKKRIWIVLAAVLVLVALTAVTVIADPFSQASSEEGVENFEEWIGTKDTIVGDDPDENGYTGEVIQSSGVIEPSEGESDLETLPLVPGLEGERPDEIGALEPQSEPQWTDFYYDFSAGATLRPRASLTNWAYWGGGCIYPSKGNDLFTLPLNLPQGSRIDYLRLFFYDASASVDGSAWITIYDGAGDVTDLINVDSAGSAGYGYAVSPYLGHVVDNVNYAYVLNYANGTTGSSIRLCGLRVAYRLP